MPRSLSAIDADLATLNIERCRIEDADLLLREERDRAVKARNRSVLAAFDLGRNMKDIAADHDMSLSAAHQVVWKTGRRCGTRRMPISHLTADQQRAYGKLLRNGVGPGAARQIVEAEHVAATDGAAALPQSLVAVLRRPVQPPTASVAVPFAPLSVRYATHDARVVGAAVVRKPERASLIPGAAA